MTKHLLLTRLPRRGGGRVAGSAARPQDVGGRVREAGSISVEMALFYVPLMVLVALVVVTFVRIASAASDVNSAAAAAARQASIARSTSGAVAGGRNAAAATLGARHLPCQPRTVRVNTSAMAPGGLVTVTISCRISLADLMGLGLPGSVTLRSTSRQVIDTYRGFQ